MLGQLSSPSFRVQGLGFGDIHRKPQSQGRDPQKCKVPSSSRNVLLIWAAKAFKTLELAMGVSENRGP